MDIKVGIGYDIHRLLAGRKLILGGVDIPHDKGLEGHSDADVMLHAVCDAILGALGKGDIGEHFPNTETQYKNISSLVLLSRVAKWMQVEGYRLSNLDIVLQSEEPSIKKHKAHMRENIAKELGIREDRINIKATTMEGLGAIGNKEGIACFASVLIIKE